MYFQWNVTHSLSTMKQRYKMLYAKHTLVHQSYLAGFISRTCEIETVQNTHCIFIHSDNFENLYRKFQCVPLLSTDKIHALTRIQVFFAILRDLICQFFQMIFIIKHFPPLGNIFNLCYQLTYEKNKRIMEKGNYDI